MRMSLFCGLVFKLVNDYVLGIFQALGLFCTLSRMAYNLTKGVRERVSRLVLMHADDREEVEMAGDIGAIVGLKYLQQEMAQMSQLVILEQITFAEPVISL